ncbi:MAG: cupin-like domain-containing protein [Candidatus Marinimicrobia bacterium]|nr:cupin-like domain-containing protein [Candidatus Neomarinimicrobiota bacterium]
MENIKTFTVNDNIEDIINYFNNQKLPFVLKNYVKNKIDLDFIENNYGNKDVIILDENSDKKIISISNFITAVQKGKKYRLRANTKLGNKIKHKIDTQYQRILRNNKQTIMDYFLSLGKTSRQHTLFVSSKDCTFTKHAHIISGFILQLHNSKDWYIAKGREKFSSIRYKSFLHPNPLYVTDKNVTEEIKLTLEAGDILYIPPYWFHYTISNEPNISYSYFFTESIYYYLKNTFLMFTYHLITNPFHSFLKAVRQEPEEHIYDRKGILERCNKIKNIEKRNEAIEFFKKSDFS